MSIAIHADAGIGTSLRSFARSIGQIVLQRNAAAGVLIVAAVFCCSPRLACALLIGALTGNVIASIIDDSDSHATRNDLHGFNGALAALAAFAYIRDDAQAGAVAIVAAMFATGLARRLTRALQRWRLPVYSSPAVLVTWCWLPLFSDPPSGAAVSAGAAAMPGMAAVLNAPHAFFPPLLKAALAGLAPIVFSTGAVAGALILTALYVARPPDAVRAFAGSALGLALHALGGSGGPALASGACGFNAALTALSTSRFGIAALAAIVFAVLIERVAAWLGVPALTAPFVLASWAVQMFVQRPDIPANHGDPNVVHPQA